MQIMFAPMQGYTDVVYRSAHASLAGGVDCYFSPFIRIEKGQVRGRDVRDIESDSNVVPQIIVNGPDELDRLSDMICERGFSRIDINMGCPHPPQMNHGRGAGLLPFPDKVAGIMDRVKARPETSYSVKMRLGMHSPDECLALLPILNDTPLKHVTVHARTARQMYRGEPQMDAFRTFLEQSVNPVIYNGAIAGVQDIKDIESRFPKVCGVMIGQGLLARPCLAAEYRTGTTWPQQRVENLVWQIHDRIFNHARQTLQGDSQILSRMQAFWQPLENTIPRKLWKQLTKTGSLKNYESLSCRHGMTSSKTFHTFAEL